MNVLSFDVGMKNLAYCLFRIENKQYTILDWDIINICSNKEEVKQICQGINKKGKKCTKQGYYFKNYFCFCKVHAKKQKYLIPTKELKNIEKLKVVDLKKLMVKHKLETNKKMLKKECIKNVNGYLEKKYFATKKKIKTKDVDFFTYGKNMKIHFERLFKNINLDLILIENQIGPLALRMKVLQGMILQHFIERNCENVISVNSSNKLKEFIQKKTTYSERKKESINITLKLLEKFNKQFIKQQQCSFFNKKTHDDGDDSNIKDTNWHEYLKKHKKKDDLADCFLQGIWYFKKYNLIAS